MIQSGIKNVIYLGDKYADTDGVKASKRMFEECVVTYQKLDVNKEIKIDLK